MIPQVRDAKRREKMRECRDYVANHADLLRGGEAAAQLTVGKGWEPPQLPKLLTKNVSIPLAYRS